MQSAFYPLSARAVHQFGLTTNGLIIQTKLTTFFFFNFGFYFSRHRFGSEGKVYCLILDFTNSYLPLGCL